MAEPALPGGSGAEPSPPAPASQESESALNQWLAQARAQNLPARDPVRWRRIDALAQRAARHSGATRQLLDARLQALIAEATAAPAPAPNGGTP